MKNLKESLIVLFGSLIGWLVFVAINTALYPVFAQLTLKVLVTTVDALRHF